jgi:hypothetical protein
VASRASVFRLSLISLFPRDQVNLYFRSCFLVFRILKPMTVFIKSDCCEVAGIMLLLGHIVSEL